ncbi:MAG: riboflavin biosynthesis protein RibF [Aminivibrio sp.]|jgi:riboflavin kinase/FMN adenylyltransferase
MIAVLGAFDGFHLGHQRLLRAAADLALKSGGEDDWGVVTFTPHPGNIVRGRKIPVLFTDPERDLLSRYFRIPATLKLPFSRALADLSPVEFLDYMEDILPLSGIVVGTDFRFGRNREGDVALMEKEAEERGWSFRAAESLVIGGEKVASSSIRNHVAHGAMDLAESLLGYPFFFTGTVVRGEGRGKKLGFPTANIDYRAEKVLPKRGVYAVSVYVEAKWMPGALNVGVNPTFHTGGGEVRAETYIIGFNGSLYGKEILVFIEQFLREESKFNSPGLLTVQMEKDVRDAMDYFSAKKQSHEKLYELFASTMDGRS